MDITVYTKPICFREISEIIVQKNVEYCHILQVFQKQDIHIKQSLNNSYPYFLLSFLTSISID